MPIDPNDWFGLTVRLIVALFVGAVIGWNRQISGKSAGLRTHMLVSLGAALFSLAPLQVAAGSGSGVGIDALSRAIQGVAAGVGFLGAGEILHHREHPLDKPKVKGLTSAAAIWVAAALGLVAGCGLWQLSLLGAGLALLTLSTIKRLERWTWIDRDED